MENQRWKNESAQLSTGQRPKSSQNTTDGTERLRQIKAFLDQSHDTFNLFGKSPEALANTLKAFASALNDQDLRDIRAAFLDWLRTHAEFPTPADIRKLCMEEAETRKIKEMRGSGSGKSVIVQHIRTGEPPRFGNWREIQPIAEFTGSENHISPFGASLRWPDLDLHFSYSVIRMAG